EGLGKALAFLDKVLELSPNQNNVIATRADLYFRSGMHREAIREYQRAYEASGRSRQYLLGASASLAVTGQMTEALRIIEESAKDPVAAEQVPYYRARLHAALGHREDALKALQAGLDTRCDCLGSLLRGTGFDFLRSDPAFHEILRRAGFPPDAIERQAAQKRP
ncbi:MAG: tetratricopeptide repeat protein, partial [Nevskiales bacterium]